MFQKGFFLMLMVWMLQLMMPLCVQSAPVDSTVAKDMAWRFFQSLPGTNMRSTMNPVVAYTGTAYIREGDRNVERPVYYIVNLGQKGFVIVAADDRVVPILAYSTTSAFNGEQMPSNMAFLLGEYQQQIVQLCDSTEEPAPAVTAAWVKVRQPSRNYSRNVVIQPLLSSKWNQFPYYNAQCPFEPRSTNGHASAGCTAVAMAQIMRYWQHPVHGVGSHSYMSNYSALGWNFGDYGLQYADFGATTYDYDHMPDSLTATSSQTEINAVATLLYHCGVSLSTAYGIANSSAVIAGVDDALRNYFDYESPQHVFRNVYAEQNWLNVLKNELNHLRPVFYTGSGTSSVHAFVCDGYDDQNFFHMNWGWGGYADGYFILSDLSPNQVNYNTAQTAIINIVVNQPSLFLSKEELTFFEEEGTPAEIQRVDVQTVNVTNNVHLSVTGHFSISLDSVNFSAQADLPAEGGAFYVKYSSIQEVSNSETAKLLVSSGAAFDTVYLIGMSYMPACPAPLSLMGIQGDVDTDTNQVLLTWQAPLADRVEFSWDSIPYNNMGSEDPYTVMMLHRMEETDLLPFHRHLLTHVSFIAIPQVTEYRIVIYKGGSLTNHGVSINCGTKIVDQPVSLSDLTMGGWNKIALDVPLVIDASQELWYGVYVSAPGQSNTLTYGNAECVPYKGNIFGIVAPNNTFWFPYSSNFILKATIDNPFLQYEVLRNGESLATVTAEDTSYADYPLEYAYYTYEVQASWNNQCSNGISKVVNFRAPCHVVNQRDSVYACDSYEWNGTTYTESGEYQYGYWNDDDCWQVDTLCLTLGHTTFAVDSIVACDSLTWLDGNTYFESTTTPFVTLTNAAMCDSLLYLHLIIIHPASDTYFVTACDSYTWIDGVTYTESIHGPTMTFTDVVGCENATLTLDLTILHSSSSEDTVVACDSYTWRDSVTYTESTNEPTMVYTNGVGCDSVITLHLTVYHSVHYTDEQVACDSYTWINGQTYTEDTDTPTMIYTGANGCDSVVTLHLTIHASTSFVDSVFSTQPYTWIDGVTYTESVVGPTVVLENGQGCDSVVTLCLTIGSGVEAYQADNLLKVWPNPTHGQVNLLISDRMTESNLEVRIYDVYGRLLQKSTMLSESLSLDLSPYAQGLYILQVSQNQTVLGTVKLSKLSK